MVRSGRLLAEQRRHELQLVVVHPDDRALGGHRRGPLGEPLVDLHVGVPPGAGGTRASRRRRGRAATARRWTCPRSSGRPPPRRARPGSATCRRTRTAPGASPAEPDQPTHAPPRPATKGSSAVTRPPGLRCQRVLPSGSVTWSTGSRLATTTTGLSARAGASGPPAVPCPLLVHPYRARPYRRLPPAAGRARPVVPGRPVAVRARRARTRPRRRRARPGCRRLTAAWPSAASAAPATPRGRSTRSCTRRRTRCPRRGGRRAGRGDVARPGTSPSSSEPVTLITNVPTGTSGRAGAARPGQHVAADRAERGGTARPAAGTARPGTAVAADVAHDLDVVDDDEPLGDELGRARGEPVDPLGGVDDDHRDRQVLGQGEQPGGVHRATRRRSPRCRETPWRRRAPRRARGARSPRRAAGGGTGRTRR